MAKGRSDGRTIVIVPEVKDGDDHRASPCCTSASPTASRHRRPAACSPGYRRRYAALHDAVTETEPTFRDDLLAEVPVVDLLTEPVNVLADRWRA